MTGDKEIERPLGQGLRPARATRGLSSGAIVAAAVVLAVVGVSGAIALREKPFRKPQETAVSTPKVTAATEPVATAAPAVAPAAPKVETSPKTGGPQIIHVQTEEGDGPSKPAIVIRDPSTVGQNLKIAHIPDRALIEASDTGPLPIRAADGRRPFDVYARPWSGARGARVAIVIGGLAVSQTGTQAAIAKLPAERLPKASPMSAKPFCGFVIPNRRPPCATSFSPNATPQKSQPWKASNLAPSTPSASSEPA